MSIRNNIHRFEDAKKDLIKSIYVVLFIGCAIIVLCDSKFYYHAVFVLLIFYGVIINMLLPGIRNYRIYSLKIKNNELD